jgi:hypothetical protein
MTHLENLPEDEFLHLCIMDPNGPTSYLYSVQNEVIVLAADLWHNC